MNTLCLTVLGALSVATGLYLVDFSNSAKAAMEAYIEEAEYWEGLYHDQNKMYVDLLNTDIKEVCSHVNNDKDLEI